MQGEPLRYYPLLGRVRAISKDSHKPNHIVWESVDYKDRETGSRRYGSWPEKAWFALAESKNQTT